MTPTTLILGVISICLGALSSGLQPFGIIAGIVGIVIGAIQKRRDYMTTETAMAGFVTSIIGTSVSTVMFVLMLCGIPYDPNIMFIFGR